MSEANTATTETTGTEAPAGNTAETGASTAPAGGEQQQSSETGQGEGQGAGNETGDTVAAPNESEAPKGDEGGDALGAPEQYADFTVPEDVELKGEMLDGLTAFAKAQRAAGQALPTAHPDGTTGVALTVNDRDKPAAAAIAHQLVRAGFTVYSTEGTARAMQQMGIQVHQVAKL